MMKSNGTSKNFNHRHQMRQQYPKKDDCNLWSK